MHHRAHSNLSPSIAEREIANFSKQAGAWWNPQGPLRPLHRLNPIRIAYVRDQILKHGLGQADTRQPLKNVTVLDVGCGGGLLAEPLARLGAKVTGLDASAEAIAEAQRHAGVSELDIDYHAGSAEELAEMCRTHPPPLAGGVRGGVHKVAPSPAKTKDLLRKSRFSLPLPQGERKTGYDVITALEIVEHVADLDSFIAALATLLKPKGLLILSTVNRTPKSFLLGVVAAEYVLRWVPRGTHNWKKFLRPSELVRCVESKGLAATDLTGIVYHPLHDEYALSKYKLDVNYMMTAVMQDSAKSN